MLSVTIPVAMVGIKYFFLLRVKHNLGHAQYVCIVIPVFLFGVCVHKRREREKDRERESVRVFVCVCVCACVCCITVSYTYLFVCCVNTSYKYFATCRLVGFPVKGK